MIANGSFHFYIRVKLIFSDLNPRLESRKNRSGEIFQVNVRLSEVNIIHKIHVTEGKKNSKGDVTPPYPRAHLWFTATAIDRGVRTYQGS